MKEKYLDRNGNYKKIKKNDIFRYIEKHPAFNEFSHFILPWKDKKNKMFTPWLPLSLICRINHADINDIVSGFNFIAKECSKHKVFYRFYLEEEIEKTPSLKDTGLYFIPGNPKLPFIFLVSGGAFQGVCNFLEAFPVSRLFHEAGYPVFILQYRVNPYLKMNLQEVEPRQKEANLDFGRAMQYIFSHKKELGIRTEDYAVCGFSAGGRLCQMWGLDNEYGYRNFDIAKPAVSMLIYSGWDDAAFDGYYCTEPPTFFASVQDDAVIGKKLSDGIEKYGEKLKELGIPVERHIYSGSLHGFGTGAGTDAEGWTDEAILFWQKCMSR